MTKKAENAGFILNNENSKLPNEHEVKIMNLSTFSLCEKSGLFLLFAGI